MICCLLNPVSDFVQLFATHFRCLFHCPPYHEVMSKPRKPDLWEAGSYFWPVISSRPIHVSIATNVLLCYQCRQLATAPSSALAIQHRSSVKPGGKHVRNIEVTRLTIWSKVMPLWCLGTKNIIAARRLLSIDKHRNNSQRMGGSTFRLVYQNSAAFHEKSAIAQEWSK